MSWMRQQSNPSWKWMPWAPSEDMFVPVCPQNTAGGIPLSMGCPSCVSLQVSLRIFQPTLTLVYLHDFNWLIGFFVIGPCMKKIFYVFDRLSGTRLWMFYYDMSPFS